MKVGLLPLYLKLYDDTVASMRTRIEAFLGKITQSLSAHGFELIVAPICREKAEFAASVTSFENQDALAIITLHLAYSPSLESIEALASSKLPLLVLNTTENYEFDNSVNASEIMYNHGIHGVQDMCNMLRRHGKSFQVFAGHYEHSDVLSRIAAYCRGIKIAHDFRNAKIGLVGEPFRGMGDFQVPFIELKNDLNIDVIHYDFDEAKAHITDLDENVITTERTEDERMFDWDECVTDGIYARSVRVGLALRKWVEEKSLTGLSVNFLETEKGHLGLSIMPFVECSKAMMRGIGYSGEGDVLTAALCGAVLQTFENTTFTEMFCPDWKGGSVFLSHMGEFNYKICSGKPRLTEKDFPFTSAENPTVAYGTYMEGESVLINLLPMGAGKYALILAPGKVLAPRGENNMKESVNGWFKPDAELEVFLEEYSKKGGTHHALLSYGDCLEAMTSFAAVMGFDCFILR